MRGNVYRHGRRRAGSIVLAMAVSLACALGGTSVAAAKPAAARARPHAAVNAPTGAAADHAKRQAQPSTVAHAAGHKIA